MMSMKSSYMSQGNPVDPQKGKVTDPVATLYPITDRPFSGSTAQTHAGAIENNKMKTL